MEFASTFIWRERSVGLSASYNSLGLSSIYYNGSGVSIRNINDMSSNRMCSVNFNANYYRSITSNSICQRHSVNVGTSPLTLQNGSIRGISVHRYFKAINFFAEFGINLHTKDISIRGNHSTSLINFNIKFAIKLKLAMKYLRNNGISINDIGYSSFILNTEFVRAWVSSLNITFRCRSVNANYNSLLWLYYGYEHYVRNVQGVSSYGMHNTCSSINFNVKFVIRSKTSVLDEM